MVTISLSLSQQTPVYTARLVFSCVVCIAKGAEPPASMPVWMYNLNKKFTSSFCPFNIRLFIAKLILNTEQVGWLHVV